MSKEIEITKEEQKDPTSNKAGTFPLLSAPLNEAVDTFIQGAGKISAALLGMVNRIGGQIYALLFLGEEPLSLDEISEQLCVSKSNVSINIRLLEENNLVRKVWVRGSRKDYYAAERTYPKKIIKGFLEKIQTNLKDSIMTIERTRSLVAKTKLKLKEEKEKTQADFMSEQLDLLAFFYYGAHQFFDDFFSGKPVDIEILRRTLFNKED